MWSAKLYVSLRLSPRRIVGSLLTLAALYTPARANVDGYCRQKDGVSMISLNGSLCGRQEDRVGSPSESSHFATGTLRRKLLFQVYSARKTNTETTSLSYEKRSRASF